MAAVPVYTAAGIVNFQIGMTEKNKRKEIETLTLK